MSDMKIKSKPMGAYETNCYIVSINNKEVIIDPGIGATKWVIENVANPVAILNTHGHFDHTWSNKELKEKLKIPIYIHKDDEFMLKEDPFSQGTPKCNGDILIKGDEKFDIDGLKFQFLHFPGHTPGCCSIVIEDNFFSGDFIFFGSIGRVDFPYSNPNDMKESIKKVLKIEKNYTLLPGHGPKTTLKTEQKRLPTWLNMI